MYRVRPRRTESVRNTTTTTALFRSFSTSPNNVPNHSVTERWRDQYDRRAQKFRDDLSERRQQLRDKAVQYRDTGMNKYREFRENPKETAVSGAKSFTAMVRTHGPVFIGTYFGIYVATLSSLYTGVASGALDPVNLFTTMGILAKDGHSAMTSVDLVHQFMSSHELSKPYAHYVQDYPPLANLGVAWIAAKFTEPVRLPLAITLTPRVARSIGYRAKTESEDDDDEKMMKQNDVATKKD